MIKKIQYYYYYLFYNAYWTSFDIGEKTVPRQNAVYYMSLLELFLLGSISFGLYSIGVPININISVAVGVAIILLLNHFALSKAKFNDYFNKYKFISKKTRKQRMWLFFTIISFAGALNVFGAFLFAL